MPKPVIKASKACLINFIENDHLRNILYKYCRKFYCTNIIISSIIHCITFGNALEFVLRTVLAEIV